MRDVRETRFQADAALHDPDGYPDELVEIVGYEHGSLRVRHEDGSETLEASYLVLRVED